MQIKKINILSILILILIVIIIKQTNLFKNIYTLNHKAHDTRQQDANDFCELFGSGYIFYIKEKFNLEKSPVIKNSAVNQEWIFSTKYQQLDENKIIFLNKDGLTKSDLKGFKILDNFQNRCFYLEKK